MPENNYIINKFNNEFSNDNTLKIINKIKKKDHQIKIINNSKNKGALYSRSIASLISKGEYKKG